MISEEEVEKQYQYMKALGDDISKEEVKEELEKYQKQKYAINHGSNVYFSRRNYRSFLSFTHI